MTASQGAAAKYFVIALVLFVVQSVLGGKMAHDYVDGDATSSASTCRSTCPSTSRVPGTCNWRSSGFATACLGMGIFLAPLVSGREPKGQLVLVNVLFAALTLLPIGVMRALESFNHGFWSARSVEFYSQPLVHKLLLWLRMIADTVFIALGVLPLVGVVYGIFHLRPLKAPAAVAAHFTGLLRTPTPSSSTSTTSPGDILRVLPGVPV